MKTKTIAQTVIFDAPPRKVYDAYVDAKKHAAFTGARATLVKKPGGKMNAWNKYVSGTILLLEPAKRIIQTWKSENWPKGKPASILDIRLQPKGKRTELTLVHSGIPAMPASLAKGFRTGWHTSYWTPLKKYLKRLGRKRN